MMSDYDLGSINKMPVAMNMTKELYAYQMSCNREPEILKELRAVTASHPMAHVQVAAEQGCFMAQQAEIIGARRTIDVGVFTGYSSLAIALALPEDGLVEALDRNPETLKVARSFWDKAGVGHKVHERCGSALESLEKILEEYGPDSFDFAFLDADKPSYPKYFEVLMKLIRKGGLIMVDNTLFSGRVIDSQVNDDNTVAIRHFNKLLSTDERISYCMMQIGDGLGICRKR